MNISNAPSLVTKLKALVSQLAKKGKVVVLVDEYDYPLLRALHSLDIAKSLRDILSSFFAALKGLDSEGYIRAIFITGVTKFSKASIFSGMNTLNDISLDIGASSLLGYTQDEIKHSFSESMEFFSQQKNISVSSIINEMTLWYNGYKFSESPEAEKVYNPFSILYYLQKQQLENYWFETGTPTFLIKLLKSRQDLFLHDALDNIVVSRKSLGAFDLESKLPLHTLLFQTGYLTIKSYDPKLKAYTLGCPNEEVRLSLSTYLIAIAANRDEEGIDSIKFSILTALNNNDLKTFCFELQNLFASIPYDKYIKNEAYFHSLFHLLTTLLGLNVQSEIHTSVGRIDLVLKTKQRIFIFEFKFNGSGEEAIQQIQNQRYYEKFLSERKPITIAGISFNFYNKKLTLDLASKTIE
jgi:Predicted AAA-ATPase/PD-(D/E)XK nuclease superfamily